MATKTKPARKWVATVGITLQDGSRLEPGDVWPTKPKPPKWLVEQGKLVATEGNHR